MTDSDVHSLIYLDYAASTPIDAQVLVNYFFDRWFRELPSADRAPETDLGSGLTPPAIRCLIVANHRRCPDLQRICIDKRLLYW